MWDAFPYMVEATAEVVGPPPLPCACACPQTPDGWESWVLRPMDRLDVLRAANRMRASEDVHCMVLDLPSQPGMITRRDLRAWAEEGTRLSGRVVVLRSPKSERFACGEKACCRCHGPTVSREQHAAFREAFGRDQSFVQALIQRYPMLTDKQVRFLNLWATAESAKRAGSKITDVELAKHFKKDKRTILRWRLQLSETYPEVFRFFERMRNERVQRTGAYEVRE